MPAALLFFFLKKGGFAVSIVRGHKIAPYRKYFMASVLGFFFFFFFFFWGGGGLFISAH